jgi:hypothetical protein
MSASTRRRWFHFAAAGAVLILASVADAAPIRDTAVAQAATGDISRAWLADETDRYRHFVLGGRFEASTLVAVDPRGRPHRFELSGGAVFEDREVRITDLDGDGRSELAVVVSRPGVGSALALFGLGPEGLRRLAETAPNGLENRWLNPSGVGRFTRTDRLEIAIVRTPHIDGRLELYSFDGRSLTLTARTAGFSTHRNGSRHQRLYAVLTRPGRTDLLVVPVLDRSALAVLDFTASPPQVTRYALPGRADGPFAVARDGTEAFSVEVPLEDGRIARVTIAAR